MAEQLLKLSPHRDLQCYFLTPSAIAAMSGASANGFAVSGKWRQQFDWAVVEWNRDNVFEHPALRNLPDGDLSGLVLSYVEQRTGCIPFESNLVPVVDWDNLRIWAPGPDGATEQVYHVNLAPLATPVNGTYEPASGTMTLLASPGVGKRVGLAFLEQHYYYIPKENDALSDIAAGLAATISAESSTFSASSNGQSVTVEWKLTSAQPGFPDLRGSNGNRITMYGFAEDGASVWKQPAIVFSGGTFPAQYRVTIDFGALKASGIPTDNIRKLRWTWSADLQAASFAQTEFQVQITDWTVTGSNRTYSVAGPGSRRIEDVDAVVSYQGQWELSSGNYSQSRIHSTTNTGDRCTIAYHENALHTLFLGTRRLTGGPAVTTSVDGVLVKSEDLSLPGEDVLVRVALGTFSAGAHTVIVEHAGGAGRELFFDFLEIAYPTNDLPDFPSQTQIGLATDWDTYHSQSLPAERTAWLIQKLGFGGTVNHYTGALWFYELVRTGTEYASLTLLLNLNSSVNARVQLNIAPAESGQDASASTAITHTVLPDDTETNIAEALSSVINNGTNLLWAAANGNQLTLTARAMGALGNGIRVTVDSSTAGVTVTPTQGGVLSGGVDGMPYTLDSNDALSATLMAAADYWQTDLNATPRLNRAARDWHVAFFGALKGYGIDAVASFSTELLNVDASAAAGMAQRYPDGSAVVLNTPAIQTNFSPTALAFWRQVYLDMASLQRQAGMVPYLQSGEVQWWYFPKQVYNARTATNENVGMPFYDAYTQQQFQARYGLPMQTILTDDADPAPFAKETQFLPVLIGEYTGAIRAALQNAYPGCRYEILYPTDTNDTPLKGLVNFPADDWTPANLTLLKTESFGFTGGYNLDQCTYSMSVSAAKGFGNSQRSHLIGITDSMSPWMKEVNLAQSQGIGSIILFALDQFCLIGYPAHPYGMSSRSVRQGR